MNITGLSNYSKETVGLRQSDKILNQQFKLIYGYPLLFADTISPNYQTSFRKFQTVSYIREIIVNNSLNIINMASQFQSDSTQRNSVAQLIGNAILTGGNTSSDINSSPIINQTVNPYEVQRRVEEKTRLIKKYLESDPRTKKLLPQVEIITLNNLLDVPLIVGTKGFSAESSVLLYILAIAVATSTPLNKLTNVESIVRKLKNTRERDWFKLLTNMIKSNEDARETWIQRFRKKYPSFQLTLINRLFKNNKDTEQESRESNRLITASNQDINNKELNAFFNIMKIMKNSLDEVLLQFRFVLDPVMLKNQIGLDTSNNTMETTIVKLSSNQRQIFMQMHDKFMELVSIPGSLLLSSCFNSLYPAPSKIFDTITQQDVDAPTDLNVNFLELKEKHFDSGLNAKMQRLINDTFSKEISNSLSSITPSESKDRIDLLKSICQSMSKVDEIFVTEVKKFTGGEYIGGGVLRSTNFDINDLDHFSSGITRLANALGSLNKRFENVFSQLVNNSSSLLKIVQTQIYSSIEDFFRDITRRPNYNSMMSYSLGVDHDKVEKIFIPQITDTLFVIFYFFFLYRLQAAICQFMDVIDVEIDSKVNDVFEFPNYTLVLPIEIVLGIYTAYVAGSFEKLLNDGNVGEVKRLNDNYVRGIIKFLCKRLKIPSIIVLDEKKQIVHYQFMFMSSPEKMTISTLDSFIRSSVN